MIFLIICTASYILPHPYDEHKSILTTSKRNLTLIDRVRHHLVNCPAHPIRFAHCDLCICQLSRRWKPSLGVSLMFELLFLGGMSVLNYSFCRISIVSAVHYKSKVRYIKKYSRAISSTSPPLSQSSVSSPSSAPPSSEWRKYVYEKT